MFKMVWDEAGKRVYETGVDRGVFYPYESGKYGTGEAWNGLISVNESPTGGEPVPFYANNRKYLNLVSYEELSFTIEAYSYPPGFKRCIGETSFLPGISIGGQSKKHFGFSYRSLVGNPLYGTNHYKIHLIFDCLASSSEKSHNSRNDSPDPLTYSWDVQTGAVLVNGNFRTASVVLDSRRFEEAGLIDAFHGFEQLLYGNEKHEATLPRIFNTDGKWLWDPFKFEQDTVFTAKSD